MNKFLSSLLKVGVYLLEQSDRTATDIRDRVKARVEDLADRQQDHTVRNVISFAVGAALGIGVAILFAPASGEDTRSAIVGKVRNVGDRVRERLSPDAKKPVTGTEG